MPGRLGAVAMPPPDYSRCQNTTPFYGTMNTFRRSKALIRSRKLKQSIMCSIRAPNILVFSQQIVYRSREWANRLTRGQPWATDSRGAT